jgi:hypothetical protein
MPHSLPAHLQSTEVGDHVNSAGAFLVRVHPSDRIVFILLLISVVVAVVCYSTVGSVLLLTQIALLTVFGSVAITLMRWDSWRGTPTVRALVTTAVIFTCYTTLGKLGIEAMPCTADQWLSRIDNAMFGFDPSLALQPYQNWGSVEFFAFFYSAFIPYINLSLLLNCLGRPNDFRTQ